MTPAYHAIWSSPQTQQNARQRKSPQQVFCVVPFEMKRSQQQPGSVTHESWRFSMANHETRQMVVKHKQRTNNRKWSRRKITNPGSGGVPLRRARRREPTPLAKARSVAGVLL